MKLRCSVVPGMVLASTLYACSFMPDQKVEGLPPLAVTEHVVEPGEIFQHCSAALSWWHWALLALPMACATIDFERQTCDLYVATNSAPETVEHERLHCQGYDHGDRVQEAYNAWKAARVAQASPVPEESARVEASGATRLGQLPLTPSAQ